MMIQEVEIVTCTNARTGKVKGRTFKFRLTHKKLDIDLEGVTVPDAAQLVRDLQRAIETVQSLNTSEMGA